MANYLVTGVAGFIGSMVARRLLESGHVVKGIDNLSTGYIEAIPDGVDFLEAGVHEPQTIKNLESERFDAILHIAGQSGGEMSYEDPVYDLQSNTQSTLLLLDLAKKTGCKRIIYAGTVSVYGDVAEPDLIDESMITFPKSFYGVGKLASENYLRIYADQFDLETVSLRLFNVYGPGQNLKNFKQGIASIYLGQALKSKHIHVKGSPDRYRDMVYIDDVVDAFVMMITLPLTGYHFYNISTGKKTKVVELVNLIKKALPFEVTTEYAGSTPGDVFGYTGNPQKMISETGWEPKISVEDGIKKMVDWSINI